MEPLPLRFSPGVDLRRAIEDAIQAACQPAAAFVVSGIGSLGAAHIRFAGAEEPTVLTGDFEILTLAGSVSSGGAHLHISIANRDGQVLGGHLAYGSVVRTTAEILALLIPEWNLTRELDAMTGFQELLVRRAT